MIPVRELRMGRSSFSKVFAVVAVVLLAVAAAAWLGILLYGRIVFADVFPLRTRLARNPGLGDGLVPQGLAWNASDGSFYTCGYMADGSPSRIYRVDPETGSVRFARLSSNGKPFHGHTGGLQCDGGFMYLADEGSGLYFFGADFPGQDEALEIGEAIPVNNNSSFVFASGGFVYVGEFNDGEKYVCRNDFSYGGTTHKAIVSKYRAGDFSTPVAVYSIGDQIQGFAVLGDGTIVLSRSYGLSPSRFLVYDGASQVATGRTMHGADVVFLGEPSRVISAPPMSEDLDVRDGKVVYMTESASRKYLFGNLYFDRHIYALDVSAPAER